MSEIDTTLKALFKMCEHTNSLVMLQQETISDMRNDLQELKDETKDTKLDIKHLKIDAEATSKTVKTIEERYEKHLDESVPFKQSMGEVKEFVNDNKTTIQNFTNAGRAFQFLFLCVLKASAIVGLVLAVTKLKS